MFTVQKFIPSEVSRSASLSTKEHLAIDEASKLYGILREIESHKDSSFNPNIDKHITIAYQAYSVLLRRYNNNDSTYDATIKLIRELLVLFLIEFNQFSSRQLFSDIVPLLPYVTLHDYSNCVIHPNFKLVILSGASAVGKDCLLDLLCEMLTGNNHSVLSLQKYSTRVERPSDSEYYEFVFESKFKSMCDDHDIVFPYKKRGDWYGFSRPSLYQLMQSNCYCLAICTKFEFLPRWLLYLDALEVTTQAFLLEAPFSHLEHRSKYRGMSRPEIKRRLDSINIDLNYIISHPEEINDTYIRIYNGDDTPKLGSAKQLYDLIVS